jgi:hypothetical protein
MSEKRKILIQLDSDPHPSVFDRVVAVDAGADELFSYGGVKPEQVRDLVYGAIFTRGPEYLKHSAVFIGGSDVSAGEKLLAEARKHMIPAARLTVSIMLDANGANTTAAAAVRAAARHLDLKGKKALVLGGTGPVGQRVALLLAREGAVVRLGSRQLARSAAACDIIRAKIASAKLEPAGTASPGELEKALLDRELVISAGAAGVVMLPKSARMTASGLRIAIDLNAVPPLGVESVEVMDKAAMRDGIIAYGAIGVGGTKMKIHKAAIAKLFESNNQVLDAEEIYALAAPF